MPDGGRERSTEGAPGVPAVVHAGQAWRSYANLFAFGLLWAGIIAVGKVGLQQGIGPVSFAFWQALGAGVLMLLVCAVRRQPLTLDRRHLIYFVVAGGIGSALPNAFAYFVIPHVGAALAGLLFALSPLFTYLLATAVGLDRLRLPRLIGVGLGLVGAAILQIGTFRISPGDGFFWLVFCLLAPAFYAFGNVYRSLAWPAGTPAPSLAAGTLLGGAVVLAPLVIRVDGLNNLLRTVEGDIALLAATVMAVVGYLVLFDLQERAGPVFLSQIAYVISLGSLAIGVTIFGEHLGLYAWVAVGFILSGVALVNRRTRGGGA